MYVNLSKITFPSFSSSSTKCRINLTELWLVEIKQKLQKELMNVPESICLKWLRVYLGKSDIQKYLLVEGSM